MADLAPDMVHYYQATATANDCFLPFASGAGYMAPGYWPDQTLDRFTEETARYMSTLGMTSLVIWNDTKWATMAPLTDFELSSYQDAIHPLGVFFPLTYPASTLPSITIAGKGLPIAKAIRDQDRRELNSKTSLPSEQRPTRCRKLLLVDSHGPDAFPPQGRLYMIV